MAEIRQEKKRIEYLDSLKGVCMILVVFCHKTLLPDSSVIGNYLMALCWLAVPCFMMTSGALMHQAKEFSFKKYFLRLLRFYLVFCIWRIFHLVYFFLSGNPFAGVKTTFSYVFLFQNLDGTDTSHMWYMIAYLIVLLVYPFTWYLFRAEKEKGYPGRKILLIVLGVVFTAGILLPSLNVLGALLGQISPKLFFDVSSFSKIMPFTNYVNMVFYFIAGAYLFEYREEISKRVHKLRWLFLVLIFVLAFLLIWMKSATTGSFAWNGLYITEGYSRISTMLMSFAAYLCFAEFGEKLKTPMRWMGTLVGRHTLGIYYLHIPVLIALMKWVYPHVPYSFTMNVVKTIVVVAICAAITAGLKKIPLVKKLVS